MAVLNAPVELLSVAKLDWFCGLTLLCEAAVTRTQSISKLTPHCVAKSDQRHAQHPLKILGIDFSCGWYQSTSEQIMVLYSWYQTDMSLYSSRYLFVLSKISGQKWQPHILHKTMLFFASQLTPLVHLATKCTYTEVDMRRNVNSIPIVYPSTSVSGVDSVLNNVRGHYKKCIFIGNKDFWIR